jgi:hypothetical protein
VLKSDADQNGYTEVYSATYFCYVSHAGTGSFATLKMTNLQKTTNQMSIICNLKNYFNTHYGTIVGFVLSIISIGYFLGIDNKLLPSSGYSINIGQTHLLFTPKIIALVFIFIYILVSFIFASLKDIPTQDKQEISNFVRLQIRFFIWIQSVIFALSTFLYYITIKKSIVFQFEINLRWLNPTFYSRLFVIHTGYIFLILIVLIFFVNQNLFGKNKIKYFLLWCQNLIFTILGFGLVAALNEDRTFVRNFGNSFLSLIANINPNFWILASILAISVISVIRLRQNSIYKNGILTLLFVLLLVEFTVFISGFGDIISFNTFGYWHKSIFLNIFWSMIFYPIASIIRHNAKENYTQKTWLSFGYHIVVFLIGLVLALSDFK